MKTKDFLRRFWERPQRMWVRRATFQVHLWTGVLLTVYVAALGVSGSILVFKDELMPRPRYVGQRPQVGACTVEELMSAMDATRVANPGDELVLASCPTAADPFFAVKLQRGVSSDGERTFYVHQRSWQVVGSVDEEASWVGWVDRFHMELLLRRNGRQWNGVGGAVLLLVALSGFVVWWPGVRRWMRGFRVSLRAKWKRINWELHSAAGIWTLVFTMMWAATTVYFAWPAAVERAIAQVSAPTTAHYPAEALAKVQSGGSVAAMQRPINVRRALEQAMQLSRGASLEGVFLGSGPAPVLTVYMARREPGDYARTDFVYFDQRSGGYLFTWHRGENHTMGDWVLWSLAPLHFGTSWGFAGKCVWSAVGLALPLMAITGLVMWWNRWLCKRLRS